MFHFLLLNSLASWLVNYHSWSPLHYTNKSYTIVYKMKKWHVTVVQFTFEHVCTTWYRRWKWLNWVSGFGTLSFFYYYNFFFLVFSFQIIIIIIINHSFRRDFWTESKGTIIIYDDSIREKSPRFLPILNENHIKTLFTNTIHMYITLQQINYVMRTFSLVE